MSKPETFNDILKSKFNNWNHPVDENNWKEMRSMIDNARKSKRRLGWAVISLVALLAGAGVYTFSTVVSGQWSVVSGQSSVTKEVAASPQGSSSEKPAKTNQQAQATASINKKKESHTGASGNNNLLLTASLSGKQAGNQGNSNSTPEPNGQPRLNEPAGQPELNQPAAVSQSVAATNSAKSSPAITSPKVISSSKTLSAQAGKNNAKKADSIGDVHGIKPNLSPSSSAKNLFSVELGVGFSGGWKYHDTIQGHSINPLAGFGFTHQFNPTWAVKTGIQVSGYGAMNSIPLQKIQYEKHGYNSIDTTIFTRWLYYVTVPVQVEYTFARENAVGAGGTISWMFTSWGNVFSYTESITGGTTITGNHSQFLDMNGYNRWNSSVYIFYKRHLFKKFSAYIMPYFGLSDMKESSFFGRNVYARDYGAKITFSYTFF